MVFIRLYSRFSFCHTISLSTVSITFEFGGTVIELWNICKGGVRYLHCLFEWVGLRVLRGTREVCEAIPTPVRDHTSPFQPQSSASCLVTCHFRVWTGTGMKEPGNRPALLRMYPRQPCQTARYIPSHWSMGQTLGGFPAPLSHILRAKLSAFLKGNVQNTRHTHV